MDLKPLPWDMSEIGKPYQAPATPLQTESVPQEPIPIPEATEKMRQILVSVEELLAEMLEETRHEISKIDEGMVSAFWARLPSDYGLDLAAAATELNSTCYAYLENLWFNPLHLYRQQRSAKNKHLKPEAFETIKIRFDSEYVLVYLPYLPPRNQNEQVLVNDLLMAKLTTIKDLPRWPSYHIAFNHVYPSDTKDLPRDVDNYSYKRVIDLINFAMRGTDCSRYCSMSMASYFSEKLPHGVYIEITPKSLENTEFESYLI